MTKIRAEWRPRMRVHWFSGPYVAESVRQIPPHREGHIRVPYFYLGYYLRSIYNFEIDLLVRAAHTRLVPCISRGRGGGSIRPAGCNHTNVHTKSLQQLRAGKTLYYLPLRCIKGRRGGKILPRPIPRSCCWEIWAFRSEICEKSTFLQCRFSIPQDFNTE